MNAPDSRSDDSADRRPLTIAAGLAAGLAAVVVLVLVAGGDDDPQSTQATTAAGTTSPASQDQLELPGTRFGYLPPGFPIDQREGAPLPGGESDLAEASAEAGCDLQTDLPDEGNAHFESERKQPDYATDPPTSGDHFANPAEAGVGAFADGAFMDAPPDNRLVHSLEHGRVLIQYSPELAEADQLALKGLWDSDSPGVILFPNSEMPYEVAATAWTQLIGCTDFDGDATIGALGAFRDEFRGRGPEPVPY